MPLMLAGAGAAALIDEVLWVRELSLVLGATARAAAIVLGAFFIGLAAGAAFFGRRADRLAAPARMLAALELGIAAATLLALWVLRTLAEAGMVAALPEPATLAIALSLVVPSTFLMGGTVPVGVRLLLDVGTGTGAPADEGAALQRAASCAAAGNTAGAAAGALLATFVLPHRFGVAGSFAAAAALNAVVALASACAWRRATRPRPAARALPAASPSSSAGRTAAAIAAGAGFLGLALEVLWTRLLAQAFENSIYSFGTILAVFLGALALGAALAGRAACAAPARLAGTLLTLVGPCVALAPVLLHASTGGLAWTGGSLGFGAYALECTWRTLLVVGPAGILSGALLPVLVRLAGGAPEQAGGSAGRILAWNTAGGVAGAFAAGFVLLEAFGLSGALLAVAVAYPVLGAAALAAGGPATRRHLLLPCAVGAGVLLAARPAAFPVVALSAGEERVVDVLCGRHGTVAVVAGRDGDLSLRLDNGYRLGSVADAELERLQADLPLLLHPEPSRVFCIGLATGITAGAALAHPVQELVVAELVPEVIVAARRHFRAPARGLFDDPRVRIVAADGRHHLAGHDATYDAILCDLVVPWHAGTGSLYTLEFYQMVRSRLAGGGLFAQWLSLPEWTEESVAMVLRAFLEVFPDATLWWGRIDPIHPVVALVGAEDRLDLGDARLQARIAAVEGPLGTGAGIEGVAALLGRYGGTLGRAALPDAMGPLNRDDDPVLELRAPVLARRIRAGTVPYFGHGPLLAWLARVQAAAPPESDPHLAGLPPALRAAARAAFDLYRERSYRLAGDAVRAKEDRPIPVAGEGAGTPTAR